VVVEVKAGVVNEPEVPVPPPPDEVHEVLLSDVQLRAAFAPFAIEEGVATRVTVGLNSTTFVGGLAVRVVVDPPPPPHDARPETANSIAKIILERTLKPTALLFDMILYLQ
jgi:hypothetical protein